MSIEILIRIIWDQFESVLKMFYLEKFLAAILFTSTRKWINIFHKIVSLLKIIKIIKIFVRILINFNEYINFNQEIILDQF